MPSDLGLGGLELPDVDDSVVARRGRVLEADEGGGRIGEDPPTERVWRVVPGMCWNAMVTVRELRFVQVMV